MPIGLALGHLVSAPKGEQAKNRILRPTVLQEPLHEEEPPGVEEDDEPPPPPAHPWGIGMSAAVPEAPKCMHEPTKIANYGPRHPYG